MLKIVKKAVWIGEVENGKKVGNDIVVVGAGLTGCEEALNLAKQGKKVTLIDMVSIENFGLGGAKFNQIALINMIKDTGIQMNGHCRLVDINDKGAVIDVNGNQETITCSDVILSLGVKPDMKEVTSFNNVAKSVINVGDCFTNRGTLYNAIHTAHEAAMRI